MSTAAGPELAPYARVAADIRARIVAGELGPGQRVPSTREITRDWGVAMATATKALSTLRQEGLVEAVRGVGTVVRGAAASPPVDPPAPRPQHPPAPTARRRQRPRAAAGDAPRSSSPRALTREAIVAAAIDIADAEGIDGLSMRRVSTELHVSTMALYRHVAGKGELVTAMIDMIYREADLPEPPPTDWRRALELAMLWEWGVYREHPWAIRLTSVSGPVVAPGLMANAEWMMSVVTDQGRSADVALEIITVLSAYTSGMALQATQAAVEENELGLDAEHWWRSKEPEFARFAAQGRYPVMFSVSGPPNVDAIFTRGMRHLLDGLTPLITAQDGDDTGQAEPHPTPT